MPQRAEPVEEPASEEHDAARDAHPAAPSPKRASSFNRFLSANWRALSVIVLLALGVVFVMLGWYGAAHTNIFSEQIPYLISGGLLGVALIVVAGFLASSASLERANEQLRRDFTTAMSS